MNESVLRMSEVMDSELGKQLQKAYARIAELEREREELLRDIDDLAEHDPFKETNPEGNDYRTGYKDGLRWCAKHLRRTERT